MPRPTAKLPLLILSLSACLIVSGCYYTQAARGQLEVLRKRESIADVIGNPETPPELVDRLRLVQQAREFSIRELGLPDNKSYQTYADVQREYVVWNVFAAPEFSLVPKHWCYPVAGCVSYRGYFKEQAALREALKLEKDGFDVHVGGVSAYSTLGKFNDPILSTMMHWDDAQLAAVLFHELAHQLLYIKDDSGFNESFASAVEEFGIERFLQSMNMHEAFDAYEEGKESRRQSTQLIGMAQSDLEAIYAQTIDDKHKRQLKQQRIDQLTADLHKLLQAMGRDATSWLQKPLNNARLASQALYEGRLPEFRIMLARCEQEIECFYAESRRISKLKKPERDEYLDSLDERAAAPIP